MSDLEKIREFWVNSPDIDDEEREDNLRVIREWESGLRAANSFGSWQGHPVTLDILSQARKMYIDTVTALGTNNNLSEMQRTELFGKQAAAMWIISMASKDVKSEIADIQAKIRRSLSVIQ